MFLEIFKMKKILIFTVVSLFYSGLYGQSISNEVSSESFITLNGSAISSIGHFKEDWNKGGGFFLNYSNVYSNHWALVFQVGLMNYKHNDDQDFGEDPKFTAIPLQVGGRYYFLLDTFRPYMLAMSGVNIVSRKYSDAGITVDTTSSHLNFQIGLGVDLLLFSQLGLDLHANYNSHLLEPTEPYNMTGLEYGIGIKWRFNGD
jgi:hypothetical protein